MTVRDAQAIDEARRFPARAQLRVDRAPSAVHDDERSMRREANDRVRRGAHRACVFEQLAPEFEDRRQLSPSVSSNPNATLKF